MNKYRYKTFWIDFQGDGRFKRERIKGKDKRILRKYTIKKLTKDSEKESLEDFFSEFSSIQQIRNIPINAETVTNFQNCFKNCENLKPLPEELNENKKTQES